MTMLFSFALIDGSIGNQENFTLDFEHSTHIPWPEISVAAILYSATMRGFVTSTFIYALLYSKSKKS